VLQSSLLCICSPAFQKGQLKLITEVVQNW